MHSLRDVVPVASITASSISSVLGVMTGLVRFQSVVSFFGLAIVVSPFVEWRPLSGAAGF